MKRIISVLIFGLAIGLGSTTPAKGGSETHTVRISIPGDADAAEAYEAIGQAARGACASRAIYAHQQRVRERECRMQFTADAVAAFDRPALTALHLERIAGQSRQLAATAGN
jgi:UrcA family protein